MVFVATTVSRQESRMRSTAGPEKIPWVTMATIFLASASFNLHTVKPAVNVMSRSHEHHVTEPLTILLTHYAYITNRMKSSNMLIQVVGIYNSSIPI